MNKSRRKLSFVVLFIAIAVVIVGTGYIAYQKTTASYCTELENQLATIASLKAGDVAQWRRERLGDATLFVRSPVLSNLLHSHLADTDDPWPREQLIAWMDAIHNYGQYDQVRITDIDGHTIVSASMEVLPADPVPTWQVPAAQPPGQPVMQDIYLSEENKQARLAVVATIPGASATGAPLGILVLGIDPGKNLFPVIKRWPTRSLTATTMLVRRSEAEPEAGPPVGRLEAVAATPVDRGPWYLRLLPLHKAVRAAQNQATSGPGTEASLVRLRSNVPDSPWALVVQMDAEEAYASLRERYRLMAAGSLVLLLSVGACSRWLLHQSHQRALRREAVAKAKLQLREQEYAALFDNLAPGVAHCRMHYGPDWQPVDFTFLSANKNFLRMLRLETLPTCRASQLAESGWLLTPEFFAPCKRTALTGEPENYRFELLPLNCHFAITVYRPAPQGFVLVCEDITARERAERMLQQSESRLRFTLEVNKIGVCEIAKDPRESYRTRMHDQLLGYPNMPPAWTLEMLIEHVVAEDRERLRTMLLDTSKSQPGNFAECRIRGQDQVLRWVQIARGTRGEDPGDSMFYLIQDISRLKQAEEGLRQRERDLQKTNAELEHLLYAASHDLKSPLVTISTFLGYLEEDLQAAEQARVEADMTHIRTASTKMSQLLDSILELSRAGRIVGVPQPTTFQAVIHSALAAVAGQLYTRGVAVDLKVAPLDLYGDQVRLAEIWQNLLDNAIKFMGDQAEPSIEIGWDVIDEKTIFRVCDNGSGIDPRFQAKVFGLFERIDTSVSGYGVGLAIVKRIVDFYEGEIWLLSAGVGQGASFYFTLPRALIQPVKGLVL